VSVATKTKEFRGMVLVGGYIHNSLRSAVKIHGNKRDCAITRFPRKEVIEYGSTVCHSSDLIRERELPSLSGGVEGKGGGRGLLNGEWRCL